MIARSFRHIFLILLLMPFLLSGCIKNEIKLEFELPEQVNEAYNMTYYASDKVKGWYTETVAAVQKGKLKMILYTRNPTIVFIMGSGSIPRAAFYAERGNKIRIEGDGDPLSWNIKGNKITEQWSEWRLDNRDALSSNDPKLINKAVVNFVRKNNDNPLSTLLLLIYYDRRYDESGFMKLWNTLKDEALKPKWMELVSRNDLLKDAPVSTQSPGTMIVHSYDNGIDTLRTGLHPTILFFWRDNDSEHNDGIALIRDLASEFPDSMRRIIADVCFDPDSLAWGSRVREDSLRKVVRAWNFHGETDSLMMRIGVNRTPWYIVVGDKGKIKYSGEDSSKAGDIFRRAAASLKKNNSTPAKK